MYGVKEINPLTPEQKEAQNAARKTVAWNDPRLARITRLRLLSDPGLDFWDVSYCYGILKDGSPVRVSLPFSQLRRSCNFHGHYCKAPSIMRQIIEYAAKDKVYAKGLNIHNAISTLV